VTLTPPNNLSAVSLTPVNSFSAVSLTPAKNFRLFGYFPVTRINRDKFFAGVVDTAEQLTPAINSHSRISPRIFEDNLRGQKSLGPLKMSLEMAHKVIVPQKKIMSRSFLNSGTLIVIFY
jgi:hypothetical protein